VEATEGPLAEDEVVEEEARFRRRGAVVIVIFGFEPIEGPGFFPGEDFGFGVDAGLEVGGDDAGLAFRGGGAAGFAAIEAGGGDLLFGTHEKTLLQEIGLARRPALEPLYDSSLADDFGFGHLELR